MHTVVVFTQPGCTACHEEVEYLSGRGVDVIVRDITADPAAISDLIALGSHVTPTTLIDDEEVVIGFDRARLDRLLGLD